MAAQAHCHAHGAQLTALRREVLELLLLRGGSAKAYDLQDDMRARHGRMAPTTVYRALEFLMDAGLVHRIDTLNAFLGCDAPGHAHVAQFLVCRNCQRVAELDDPTLNRVLAEKSRSMGFRIEPSALEIKGLCNDCAAHGSPAA